MKYLHRQISNVLLSLKKQVIENKKNKKTESLHMAINGKGKNEVVLL